MLPRRPQPGRIGLASRAAVHPVARLAGRAIAAATAACRPHDRRLPHDLSPWGMFLAADIVVKGVMIGLAFASVLVWTVWLAKTIELLGAKRALRRSRSYSRRRSARLPTRRDCLARAARHRRRTACGAAETELRLSADLPDKDGIEERVASRIADIEAAAARAISTGTGLLATIGATAPFVGLFGTVWGIMNSFIGISKAQTTNLAVVAPGIAEALLATAIGLVAAIPAVIIYNQLARAIAGYRALVRENASPRSCACCRAISTAAGGAIARRRARAAE